jgi:hypothetical protein
MIGLTAREDPRLLLKDPLSADLLAAAGFSFKEDNRGALVWRFRNDLHVSAASESAKPDHQSEFP